MGSKAVTPENWPTQLVQLAGLEKPPARFAAGTDAMQAFENKANTLVAQARAYRDLSSSLAHEDS
jgi:hypothetical protein